MNYFSLTTYTYRLTPQFVACILGLFVSYYFYAVLLLDICLHDADLQNVFRAVTVHGRSIMMTAFLGMIMICALPTAYCTTY